MANDINIRNKKATFEYELIEKFYAGIQLFGTEIKSIRQGKASLVDSYCIFVHSELWIKMQISEYTHGGYYNHDPRRDRKLLLKHQELSRLEKKVKTSGLSIIPLRLFINERGLAKIEIALCRGKKAHDKREDLKTKDSKRELDKVMKNKF